MSEIFKLDAVENGDRIELMVSGPLDSQGAALLKDEGRVLLDRGVRTLVVDCAAVSFISSSGIGSFLVLQDEFEDEEGIACFRNPSPEVRSVIRLMDLEGILNLVADESEVLALVTSCARREPTR